MPNVTSTDIEEFADAIKNYHWRKEPFDEAKKNFLNSQIGMEIRNKYFDEQAHYFISEAAKNVLIEPLILITLSYIFYKAARPKKPVILSKFQKCKLFLTKPILEYIKKKSTQEIYLIMCFMFIIVLYYIYLNKTKPSSKKPYNFYEPKSMLKSI